MFAVIWEYTLRPGATEAFERLYGPGGEWVALFGRYPGYLGTELLRDTSADRWLTIDRWESEAAYEAFQAAAAPEYAQLDASGDALTKEERRIGRYLPSC